METIIEVTNIRDHWLGVKSNRRKRLDWFNSAGIPPCWVVGSLPDEKVLKNIKIHAIPLTPGGLNSASKDEAQTRLDGIQNKYGEVFMFAVPNGQTESGWSAGPVLLADLEKNPDEIDEETVRAYISGDEFFGAMKEFAFMLITGDTNR